jgi:transcriptional regulator with XRE-family HTH domain
MCPRNDDLSPSEIERLLYSADQFIDGLFPQTEADIAEMQTMFGSTPVELPERLREPEAVLDRIIQQETDNQTTSPFGTLVTMLRTEKKLSIDQLARKTDLDAEDLRCVESGGKAASPLAVAVLAEFFRLQPQKVMRLAGLTRESDDVSRDESLAVAACAKPNFDSLTSQERTMFRALVKQLRKQG